jgi:uncharacterized protein (TIGR02646 family)
LANVRRIFEFFEIDTEIEKMHEANILYLVVTKFCEVDLYSIESEDMGRLFEHLIRKFNELANETAGDHFTPREVIHLMVDLLFIDDDAILSKPNVVRKLLDPACGTGGMLAQALSYIEEHEQAAELWVFGQDYNKRAYAVAASDLLLKGRDNSEIAFGDSFTDDQFGPDDPTTHGGFDYLLANPPFGVDWKKQQKEIQREHEKLGFAGRFGAGLPQPRALIVWRAANAAILDAEYGTHGFPTAEVQQSLLREQGWICAYTMIRVEAGSSHIEHFKPRTVSRAEENLTETAAYDNMVACYLRVHLASNPPVAFGAIFRKSVWDANQFISPLTATCEKAYRFRISGEIEPVPQSNGKAKWMISTLALDAEELSELRRAAIKAMGLSLTSDDPISPKQARQLLTEVCKADGERRFRPYCMALKQAAQEYIQVIEKKAKRKRHIRAAHKRRQK